MSRVCRLSHVGMLFTNVLCSWLGSGPEHLVPAPATGCALGPEMKFAMTRPCLLATPSSARWSRPAVLPVAMAVLLLAFSLGATELTAACQRLTPARERELNARARLLILSQSSDARPRAPELVHVGCNTSRAWLVWDGTSQPTAIDERHGLIEGVLVAIEHRLAQASREPTPVRDIQPDATSAPDGATDVDSGRAREAARADTSASDWDIEAHHRQTGTGGLGLGFGAEPWPSPATQGLGPRFDLGVGAAGFAFHMIEAVRFGAAGEYALAQFETQLGANYGAPFRATDRWGAGLALGRDWWTTTTDVPDVQTDASWLATARLQVAQHFGPVSTWLGPELRFRFNPPRLPPPVAAHLARWSVSLTLGCVYLVDAGDQ